jgi:hypothetical protein
MQDTIITANSLRVSTNATNNEHKRADHCYVYHRHHRVQYAIRMTTLKMVAQCVTSFKTHTRPSVYNWYIVAHYTYFNTDLHEYIFDCVGRVAQSIQRLAASWAVRGSNPGGGESFRTCPQRHWGSPCLLYNGYRVFPRGRMRPRRDADPSPLLAPRCKNTVELYRYSP